MAMFTLMTMEFASENQPDEERWLGDTTCKNGSVGVVLKAALNVIRANEMSLNEL